MSLDEGHSNAPLVYAWLRVAKVLRRRQHAPELSHLFQKLPNRVKRRGFVAQPLGRGNEQREMYLGTLYPTENYRIYGYITNTKVKFIVIVENTNSLSKDSEIKQVFRTLHVAYCQNLLNPFYTPGEPITSRAFNRAVEGLLQGTAST